MKEKTDGEDEQQATRPKKKLWADEKKWEHDKYVEVRGARNYACGTPHVPVNPSCCNCTLTNVLERFRMMTTSRPKVAEGMLQDVRVEDQRQAHHETRILSSRG